MNLEEYLESKQDLGFQDIEKIVHSLLRECEMKKNNFLSLHPKNIWLMKEKGICLEFLGYDFLNIEQNFNINRMVLIGKNLPQVSLLLIFLKLLASCSDQELC